MEATTQVVWIVGVMWSQSSTELHGLKKKRIGPVGPKWEDDEITKSEIWVVGPYLWMAASFFFFLTCISACFWALDIRKSKNAFFLRSLRHEKETEKQLNINFKRSVWSRYGVAKHLQKTERKGLMTASLTFFARATLICPSLFLELCPFASKCTHGWSFYLAWINLHEPCFYYYIFLWLFDLVQNFLRLMSHPLTGYFDSLIQSLSSYMIVLSWISSSA